MGKCSRLYRKYSGKMHCGVYPSTLEDSQIAIVRKAQNMGRRDIKPIPEIHSLAKEYAADYEQNRTKIYSYLKEYVSKGGKVAFYGAGHLSVMLINSLRIENFIEFVADDTEQKQGFYLSGTALKIKSSDALEKERISLCVLCLSVEHEKRIMQKHQSFIARGGIFLSAFPMQENSLLNFAMKDLNHGHLSLNKEVLYAVDDVIQVDASDVQELKRKAGRNPRRRIRICAHKDVSENLHEMLIVHEKSCYVRPHKHIDKTESFHIIEGSADVILFDENGRINQSIMMGDYATARNFFYRLPRSRYHTLLIQSDVLVFHEITNGPFRPEDTVWAPWAPGQNKKEEVSQYMATLAESLRKKATNE